MTQEKKERKKEKMLSALQISNPDLSSYLPDSSAQLLASTSALMSSQHLTLGMPQTES